MNYFNFKYLIIKLFILFLSGCWINRPPEIYSPPWGPSSGMIEEIMNFSGRALDPDGDDISYRFDWGDGSYSPWSDYVSSGYRISMSHSYSEEGIYQVRVIANDVKGNKSNWSNAHPVVIVKWKFPAGGPSSPAIGDDGTIYVGSLDCNVYAINPDGSQKWTFQTGDYVESSPAIGSDGTIYIGSNDHNLYAMNPDGTLQWKFTTNDKILGTPALGSDGTVYVGSLDNNVYAINPDGTEKWMFRTSEFPYEGVVASPAIASDGTIYIVSNDEYLYAINPDGTLKWRFGAGVCFVEAPSIDNDGTIYVLNLRSLYAINPDGTLKWKSEMGDCRAGRTTPAIGSDGTIYVAMRYPIEPKRFRLYAISPSGIKYWVFSAEDGGVCESSPAVGSNGIIYVGSGGNSLYAINHYGRQEWMVTTEDWVWSSPAIAKDGTLYFSSDGLYAISCYSGGLANSPWPMFGHDIKHTGRVEGR